MPWGHSSLEVPDRGAQSEQFLFSHPESRLVSSTRTPTSQHNSRLLPSANSHLPDGTRAGTYVSRFMEPMTPFSSHGSSFCFENFSKEMSSHLAM